MPADFRIDELRSELDAARDELDKWVDKQLGGLQAQHATHKETVQKGNGTRCPQQMFDLQILSIRA